MYKYFAMLFTVLIIFNQSAMATPVYNIETLNTEKLVNHYWKIPNENKQKLLLSQIQKIAQSDWQRVQNNVFNITNSPQGHWFVLELANNFTTDKSIYISILNNSFITQMQLYGQNNDLAAKDIPLLLTNSNLRISRITVPAQQKTKLFLHVVAEHKVSFNIKLYDTNSFIKNHSSHQFNTGIAIGGIVCLALIELFWFFASGLKSALLLTGYFMTRAMLLAILLGLNLFYLLPDMPELRGVDLPLLIALSSVFYLWFIVELFNLSQQAPQLSRFIRYFCWLLLLYIPLSLLLNVPENSFISIILYISTSIIVAFTAYTLIKQHNQLGTLLALVAVLQLMFATAILSSSALFGLNLIHYHDNLIYSAFWVNGILISFLLSRQYYFESKDKEVAQRHALEHAISSTNAQNELLHVQKESQDLLEQHVQERTLELNIALQELEEANRELERKNTLDELTGLNNRRFYDQKVLAEFRRSKRNLTPLSLLLIDIDHFKKVNDTYGHLAGDHCLQQLAKIMKESLKRSTDIGCRYGGEEFCLILPDTDTLGAIELAENLRRKVSQSIFEFEDTTLNLTISCGVSTYQQQDNVTPEKIFAAADKALYQAKHKGRNQTWQFAIDDL
ncbi:MAG: hypothetical protein COB35_03540 [Gammaproteobacteria bacterium]|nr:MAG: hypothetical protein COB35_03540 [Gammaproteobacteria bacterium]